MKNTTQHPMRANGAFPLKPLSGSIARWTRNPATWSLMIGAMPALALAQMPTGGTVAAGAVTITTPDANHTVINQTSNRGVINWQGFSVGSEGYVRFVQQSASAATLNRVVGGDPSSILGRISANGQVFLVNPNGVFFGANAVIDVAGIVATTLNIRDNDFMAGDYRFTRDANTPEGATVINEGTINANGGYVVLAGDYAANKGVIQAQLGTALLASGSAMTLQMAGSTLINYAVDQATVAHLAGVANSGQILANGGRVIMTADVAHDLAATVVNNSGLIQAQSTVEKDGAIYLQGSGGDVVNSGKLDASAQAGAKGGHVEMRATGDLVHAAGSLISVNGADSGVSDAGTVYTWADGVNRYKAGAAITARGGAQGGDGGQVELSGDGVAMESIVDLRAPHGKLGTLSLDPNYIYISTDGSSAGADGTPDALIQESILEGQLQMGNVTHTATGAGAKIVLGDLADGTLDGTNNGSGGSLTMIASGAGSSIAFNNTGNTIKVDGSLTLTADNGAGGYGGTSINVGHLVAGQGTPTGGGLNSATAWTASLTLDAGTVTAQSLTLGGNISSNTDSVYNLNARAHEGALTINGDVTLDVVNTLVGGIKTDVTLTSDTGDVIVDGNVTSSAKGQGYYQYDWATGGNSAPTYYGTQPWSVTGQRDHAIGTNLSINAGGSVNVTGATNVLAVDTGLNFRDSDTMGGYWQTAGDTNRVFWRATAPTATATVTAGGDASFGGAITVRADGYVTESYDETEAWTQMGQQWNVTGNSQTVHTNYGCLNGTNPCTGGMGYRDSYVVQTTTQQAGTTGNWIWHQSGTNLNGSDSDVSQNSDTWSVGTSGTNAGPMSYGNVAGPKAAFTLEAGGDVNLNGVNVLGTNRATSGAGGYNDVNWATQNTAGGSAANHNINSVSSAQETWWHDDFTSTYNVANVTATAAITAGTDKSITLNAGADNNVIAKHVVGQSETAVGASDSTAFASMSLATGAGGSGSGVITLNGPITVRGAHNADIALTVTNHGGPINQADSSAAISVTNAYNSGDARATFIADYAGAHGSSGNITLDDVAVNAGRGAYLAATANQALALTGAVSATASTTAKIDLTASNDALTAAESITATANNGQATIAMAGKAGVTTAAAAAIAASGSSVASVAISSSQADVTTNGTISAVASAGTGTATVAIDGKTGVAINNAITATAENYLAGSYPSYLVGGGGKATIDVNSDGDIVIDGNLNAKAHTTSTITVLSSEKLTLAAGNAISALAVGTANNANDGYAYSADVSLSGGTGLQVDGNVSATASNNSLLNNGNATVSLTTTGDATAAITQGASSIVKADGKTASVTVQAGNANAATIALAGALQVHSSIGTATLTVDGESGSVHNFSAISTGNLATATITAHDGELAANGTGTVTGNFASPTGAQLAMTGDSLDLGGSSINVTNSSVEPGSGAKATFTATAGSSKLDAVSVAGRSIADLSATSTGSMTVDGNLSANATHGAATIALTTTGGATSGITQDAASTIQATGVSASVVVAAGAAAPDATTAAALSLNGTINADSTIQSATIEIDGASGTVHNFRAKSTLAGAASVAINAHKNAQLTLNGVGEVSIANSNGADTYLDVTSAGSLDTSAATLSALNDNYNAYATLTAETGDAILGAISVTGANEAILTATAAGKVQASGALSATLVQLTPPGFMSFGMLPQTRAQVNLISTGANVVIDAGKEVKADGGGIANAEVNLSGATGIAVNGDITADAALQDALVTLFTTADGAAITQGGASMIAATGDSASVRIMAGPNTNVLAPTFALDGSIEANGATGPAAIEITGKSGSVHNFSASSNGDTASVDIAALDGSLTIGKGAGSDLGQGSVRSNDYASLTLNSTDGALDTSNAELQVTSDSSDATARLTATRGAARLGKISVTGESLATLSAYADDQLRVSGDLSATLNQAAPTFARMLTAIDPIARIELVSSSADVVTDAGTKVTATGNSLGNADIIVSGATGVQVDGDITADATDFDASVKLYTTADDAAIGQGGASTIAASGNSGIVQIMAYQQSFVAPDAPTLALNGNIEARGTFGTAIIEIAGKSGSVHDFSAISTFDEASVDITTSEGSLTLGKGAGNDIGQGSVRGNDRATLTLTSAGGLDTSNAALDVTSENYLAEAILAANGGNGHLGAVSVTGGGTATLSAIAEGQLQVSGNLSATLQPAVLTFTMMAPTPTRARIDLVSNTAGVIVDANHAVTATGNGFGDAEVNLTGATGVQVNGNITADAVDRTASIKLLTVADNAAIGQGGASSIVATGDIASVTAGSTDEVAGIPTFALNGGIQAHGTTGDADIKIKGKSGTVHDFSATSAAGNARVDIATTSGALVMNGNGTVNGNTGAELSALSQGSLDSSAAMLAVTSSAGTAGAFVAAAGGDASLGAISATGDSRATVFAGGLGNVTFNGALSATANGADGVAGVMLLAGGSMTANGNVTATANNGQAAIGMQGASGITQGGNSTIAATGMTADVVLNAGAMEGPDAASAADVVLNGDVQARGTSGAASIDINGKSVSVHNFSAASNSDAAIVTINALNGSMSFTGAGTVSAGGAQAALLATASGAMDIAGNLAASASGAGSSLVKLYTSGADAGSNIVQQAGSITATSASGDATVDIQAGACCNAGATLNGAVAAVVNGGDGNAAVAVRANEIRVNNAASAIANGAGNALIDLAAPTAITVNGLLTVKAVDAGKRADLKLISDRLDYAGANPILSMGNGHVQLAAFDTRRVIGVDSDKDFDAEIQTNYSLATLQKFMGNQAEITFGGEYDRSAWTNGTPETACLPGMNLWASQLQQTADIHVAGNGGLNLGDVKMVFDTTGITYYHDKQMSPWSVPAGRVAMFVARPNIDRYLDRTDNTLQTMTKFIENTTADSLTNTGFDAAGPVPGSTLIEGNLYLLGDGVNVGVQVASADGAPSGEVTKVETSNQVDTGSTPSDGQPSGQAGGADGGQPSGQAGNGGNGGNSQPSGQADGAQPSGQSGSTDGAQPSGESGDKKDSAEEDESRRRRAATQAKKP